MLTLVLILIFAALSKPSGEMGIWPAIFGLKWYITGGLLIILAIMLKGWFKKEERTTWVQSTWGFMKQIFPLLLAGVLVAGFMVLAFSGFTLNADMGLMTALTIVLALALDFFFLPTLLLKMEEKHQ